MRRTALLMTIFLVAGCTAHASGAPAPSSHPSDAPAAQPAVDYTKWAKRIEQVRLSGAVRPQQHQKRRRVQGELAESLEPVDLDPSEPGYLSTVVARARAG